MSDEIKPSDLNTAGIDPKVLAVLSYFLWLIGGIVLFAVSKNQFVRFHAMQSIIFNIVVALLAAVLQIFGFLLWFLLGVVLWLAYMAIFAVWILLMIKAYQGEKFKLPIIGQLAEKLVSR